MTTLSERNPERAWWVKVDRAREHFATLRHVIEEYLEGFPYALDREKTTKPHRFAFRLRIDQDLPPRASAIIGDVVHNLRSALDCFAFGLAEWSLGRPLTDAEERLVAFPISETPADFDRFFDNRSRPRAQLYSLEARSAMRSLQSFYSEELAAGQLGTTEAELAARLEHAFTSSPLARLNHLDNLNKHRRLALTGFWPSFVYFGLKSGAQARLEWSGTFANGEVFYFLEGRDAYKVKLRHEFALALTDDPLYRPAEPNFQPIDCLRTLLTMTEEVVRTIAHIEVLLTEQMQDDSAFPCPESALRPRDFAKLRTSSPR